MQPLLTLFLISHLCYNAFAADSFRDRLREKVKERWQKRSQAALPPKVHTSSGKISSGRYTFSLTVNNLNRYYILHVPKNYDEKKATPLIIFMHGGGGNMFYKSNDQKFNIISKSEEAGFIALIPNGYSTNASGKTAFWNAGHCCSDSRDHKVDDVAFIRAVINDAKTKVAVDNERIFASGMSNGAMMAYRLACEMSDVIKGIAAVAGTDNTIECKPERGVSILHIHAKNDDHVQFNGGIGPGTPVDKSRVTDYVSVPKTIEKWIGLNHCSPKPTRVLEQAGAYCDLYQGCKDHSRVKLCVTKTGGHSWPGGKKRGKYTTSSLSAVDTLWEFFSGK